jgi:lipoate-protein ligase A
LQRLEAMLRPPKLLSEGMEARGVASVRSRVVNLRDLAPALDDAALYSAIAEEFCLEYDLTPPPLVLPLVDPVRDIDAMPGLADIRREFASWEWTFGQTPPFTVRQTLDLPSAGKTVRGNL